MLMVGSAIMFPYTFLPILNSVPKNRDVWVSFIVSLVLMIFLNAPILYIAKKFRGLSINQIYEAISGKIVGKILLFVYVLFFTMCYFTCMLVALQFIQSSIMLRTPMWAMVLLTIIPITYAATKGPGVVARLSVFIVPLILLTIIIFAVSGAEFFELSLIKPVLADSYFLDILKGAFSTATRFSEVSILLVFSYFLKPDASTTRAYFVNLALFGIFFLLILLPVLLTLGHELALSTINPYFVYTRQVQLFNVIEKIQSLNTMVWYPCMLLKLSIYNCMASFVLSQMFKKVKQPGVFSIGISVLCAILAVIPFLDRTVVTSTLLSDAVMPNVIFVLVTVIPFIMLIVYGLRKKKVDQKVQDIMNSPPQIALNQSNDENQIATSQDEMSENDVPEAE